MGLFGKPKYDRSESMSRAAKAEGRGKRKKAIAEYRKVLAKEPENPAILVKLATLLVAGSESATEGSMLDLGRLGGGLALRRA